MQNNKIDAIQMQIAKLPSFDQNPLVVIEDPNKPHSCLEWIGSRTFVAEESPFEYSASYMFESYLIPFYLKLTRDANPVEKDKIMELLSAIPQDFIVSKIFKIAALEFLEAKNYLLVPGNVMDIEDNEWYSCPPDNGINNTVVKGVEHTEGVSGTAGYAYSPYCNRIAYTVVAKNYLDQQFKLTLTHELSHHAMRIVFNNYFNPYFSNSTDAKAAYEEAISNTLVNIHQYWFNETIATNEFSDSWELGQFVRNKINSELELIAFSALIGFPIKLLSRFEKDIEHVNHDIGSVIKGGWDDKSSSSSLATKDHIGIFLGTYDLEYYNKTDEHSEFIVSYPEALAMGIPQDLEEVFHPMHDYFIEYVVPEMDKYLSQHESAHLVI